MHISFSYAIWTPCRIRRSSTPSFTHLQRVHLTGALRQLGHSALQTSDALGELAVFVHQQFAVEENVFEKSFRGRVVVAFFILQINSRYLIHGAVDVSHKATDGRHQSRLCGNFVWAKRKEHMDQVSRHSSWLPGLKVSGLTVCCCKLRPTDA